MNRALVASLLLGVIAADLATTILRRRLSGKPLFTGDRSHIYDQLRDRGRSVWQVVATMAAAQTGFVAAALAIDRLGRGSTRILLAIAVVGLAATIIVSAGFLRSDSAAG